MAVSCEVRKRAVDSHCAYYYDWKIVLTTMLRTILFVYSQAHLDNVRSTTDIKLININRTV